MLDAEAARSPAVDGPLFDDALTSARNSSRRLAELLRSEHNQLAEFLVAVAEFDRDRLWRQLGYASLFKFLHHELGLSNAAAFYRKTAAELIQRFPEVVEPLRDGRLCITSVVELARVMTDENRAEVLPRFFDRSKREAKALAAEIRPADVIPRREVVTEVPGSVAFHPGETAMTRPAGVQAPVGADAGVTPGASTRGKPGIPQGAPTVRSAVAEPLTAELCRLHLTVTRKFLAKLDSARDGQSHAQPGASAGEVIETALDLLLEHQAKRRGAVANPQANPRPSGPDHLPAAVRRAVWDRDQGRCQWPLDSGGHCNSTWQVEVDHVVPRALGGPSTVENCRLLCRSHNDLAARLVYGNDWMDQFTTGT